jgi:hypothetical protein
VLRRHPGDACLVAVWGEGVLVVQADEEHGPYIDLYHGPLSPVKLTYQLLAHCRFVVLSRGLKYVECVLYLWTYSDQQLYKTVLVQRTHVHNCIDGWLCGVYLVVAHFYWLVGGALANQNHWTALDHSLFRTWDFVLCPTVLSWA